MKKMLTKMGASSLAALMAVGVPAVSTVPVLADSPDDGITIGKTEGDGAVASLLDGATPAAKTLDVYFVTAYDEQAGEGGLFTGHHPEEIQGSVSGNVVNLQYASSVKEDSGVKVEVWKLSYELGSETVGRVLNLNVAEGEKFFGWFDCDGNPVTQGTSLTDGAVYYASFNSNLVKENADLVSDVVGSVSGEVDEIPDAPVEDAETTTVSFQLDESKGTFEHLDQLYVDGVSGVSFGTDGILSVSYEGNKPIVLPHVVPADGYVFEGWQVGMGHEVTTETEIHEGDVITAVFSEEKPEQEIVSASFKVNTHHGTLDTAPLYDEDGSLKDGIFATTMSGDGSVLDIQYVGTPVAMPNVIPVGEATFDGWVLDDGTVLEDASQIADGAVYSAVLNPIKDEPENPGDGDDTEDPGQKPGDGDDTENPGDGDDTEKPGDGDDTENPGDKPGDGDNTEDPGQKPGDGDETPDDDTDAETKYTVWGTDVNGQELELAVEPETTLAELTNMLGYENVADWVLSQEAGKISFADDTKPVSEMTVAQLADQIAVGGDITVEFLDADGEVIDTRVLRAGEYEDELIMAPVEDTEDPGNKPGDGDNTEDPGQKPDDGDDTEKPGDGDDTEKPGNKPGDDGQKPSDGNQTDDKDDGKDDTIYSGTYTLILTRVDDKGDKEEGATVTVKGNNTLAELAEALQYPDITDFAMRQASGSSVDVNGQTKLGDIFKALENGEVQLLFYQDGGFYMSLILSPVPDKENTYTAIESKDEKATLRTTSQIEEDMKKGKGEGESTDNTVSKSGKGDSVAPGVQTDDTNTLAVYGVAGGAIAITAGLGVVIYRKKFMPV